MGTVRRPEKADSVETASETGDDAGMDWVLREVARLSDDPTPADEPDRTGQTLSHFRIRSKLGRGGMGIVYLADDLTLQRAVALKILPGSVVANEARRRLFLREARSASAVLHPNLATVFEVGEADETVFIAMEFVEGSTLRDLLAERGRLETGEALRILREIARGVGKAHARGIVHRDLKPENVMVARDGHVKVLDFGLAKPIAAGVATVERGADAAREDLPLEQVDDGASHVGRIVGTPGYMSPEQAGGEAVDARSDVFSLGVIAYEMLSSARPFRGASLSELRRSLEKDAPRPLRDAGVPAALASIVHRCLWTRRDQRFADGDALLAALERVEPHEGRATARRALWVVPALVAASLVAWKLSPRPESAPPTTGSVTDTAGTASALAPGATPTTRTSEGEGMSRPVEEARVVAPPKVVASSPPKKAHEDARRARPAAAESASTPNATAVPPRSRATADPAPSAAGTASAPSADMSARALLGF
jgi:serine/threonine-protein kinase